MGETHQIWGATAPSKIRALLWASSDVPGELPLALDPIRSSALTTKLASEVMGCNEELSIIDQTPGAVVAGSTLSPPAKGGRPL
jgi:hypothetical protein